VSTNPPGSSREDPRIRRTRQLLRQALEDMLAEKSFQAITVQDIAQRATVNRATFYAHFPDKYALLEYAARAMFRDRLQNEISEGPPFSPERLVLLMKTVCEFLADTAHHCPPPHGQMEPIMEKQIKAELVDVLLGWLDGAGSTPTPGGSTAELKATMAAWAIYGAAVQWRREQPARPAEEFARQASPLILAALGPAARLPRQAHFSIAAAEIEP